MAGLKRKKKKADEADLDITPMIDVTFLLLIFFMVTSTMQATPDKDIPPAFNGTNANMAGFVELAVFAGKSSGAEAEIKMKGQPVNLEELKEKLLEEGRNGLKIMIFAERDVRNADMAELEAIIGEVVTELGEGGSEEIEVNFAVQEKK